MTRDISKNELSADASLETSNVLHDTNKNAKYGVYEACQKEEEGCLVSEADMLRLGAWNSVVPKRVDRCVQELVVEQCRSQPDALAICAWDGNFTYAELDALSSVLSAHLAKRGVGPEVLVPLYFEKSRWTTVAMVGVMKAGGAFVLLDPSHPQARLEIICRTVAAQVVVSSATNHVRAAALAAVVVVVGDNETAWRSQIRSWAGSLVNPNNALYVVFTSGSTGTPKGAVISHAAFATSAMAQIPRYHLTRQSRVLQFSSYAFDASILEIVTTLVVGGCVCVPSDAARRDNIAGAAHELRISVAQLTPSITRLLRPADLPTLQTLVLGGEAIAQKDIQQWHGHVQLVNAYGPAECSVVASVHPTLSAVSDAGNIGWASGCVCWVVDRADHERLVPIGAVGELLIEGPTVARGYLKDPERTAAAFIELPTWLRQFRHDNCDLGGGRLYKTGDLVQYAADGSLRFVGRKDTQVKLRGQRIELGEVEHQTRRTFPGARDVVAEVVTAADAGRAPMLVAFVWVDNQTLNNSDGDGRSGDDEAADILAAPTDGFCAAIRTAETKLHDAIPPYMVPAVFLPLRGVPLSATGKTDRRRLRDRAAALSRADIEAYSGSTAAKRRPSTPAECTLQALWAQVLNCPLNYIGADDSFFGLGGDSISAMHLVSLTTSQGFTLSVSEIFTLPQLCKLATVLLKGQSIDTSSNAEPFSLLDPQQNYDLINTQPGSLSLTNDAILDIMPVTGYQAALLTRWCLTYFCFSIQGTVDLERLRLACHSLVQIHSIMRTVFIRHQDKLFQVVLKSFDVPFHHIHTQESLESACRSVWMVDSNEEAISSEPLVKFTLFSRSETEHLLSIRISHAQYDGFSKPFILRDVVAAYNEDTPPGPVCATFRDYVYYCASNYSDSAFKFWKDYLQGSVMTVLPCPALQADQVPKGVHEIALGDFPSGLDDITIPTLINAAFSFLLADLTKKDDVVFGVVTNTRATPMPQVQTILGPCLNLNPLRARLAQVYTARDLCRLLRDQYAQSLQFCHVDFFDIRAKSTEWPSDTVPGCILNHLDGSASDPLPLRNGASISSSFTMARFDLPDQLYIRSIPGNGKLQIEILTSDKIMDSEQAMLLAKRLINTANAFAKSPEAPLSSIIL
ncbi:hypothetical protein N7451_005471 [Penicillium sp. IBT 35674x]|nr:hypothetical protein N7451_005471 [Penicillium sp. IBT 35674x]